jgi:hypothetical protein
MYIGEKNKEVKAILEGKANCRLHRMLSNKCNNNLSLATGHTLLWNQFFYIQQRDICLSFCDRIIFFGDTIIGS